MFDRSSDEPVIQCCLLDVTRNFFSVRVERVFEQNKEPLVVHVSDEVRLAVKKVYRILEIHDCMNIK